MKRTLSLLAATSVLALSSAHAGDITGRVTDNSGVVPLRGALVEVQGTGQSAATGRDGSFRLSGLAAGSYKLNITYVGAETATVSVDLASASDVASIDVQLGGGEDEILVIGQRGSLNSALSQQRSADGIITVLSADAIGQLPDENVAEAARRALGVSIANDQGEGRFVTIRGMNSNLNATSVNGVRLTSPEANDRRVAMDVIDSDILKNIVINKTLSADMDGDAIGGSIDLETISGLDRDDMFAKVKIGTIYSELSEEFGQKYSGTFTNNYLDGRLGVALSGSFQNREFGSENKEVDGDWVTDETLPYPEEELEFRNYDIERERMSLAANFDYLLSDDTGVYFRTLYNDFSDQEYRSRVEFKVEDASFDFDGNNVIVGTDGGNDEFEIDRDIKDRLEEQMIYSVATGFVSEKGPWTLDGAISYTHAQEKEPDRIDANFDQGFDSDGDEFAIDVSDPLLPRVVFTNAATQALILDPSEYGLDKVESTNGLSEDDELAFEFNARKDVMFGTNPGYLKGGFKSRNRDKSYDMAFREYSFEGDGNDLDSFVRSVDYPLDVFGPAANPFLLRDFFEANVNDPSVFELAAADSFYETALASYDAEEDVLAGYFMGQVDIDKLRLTGGIRVEQTDVSANANVLEETGADTGPEFAVNAISFEDDYTDVLPSVAARYKLNDNTNIRASYYASIFRPNFGQFVPAGEINDDDELEAGNPDLERTESQNFDLMFEYYPTGSSIIQAGVFYKDLTNMIAPIEFGDPGTFNGLAYDELVTWQNADGEITGFELGYQQSMDFLPAPWDGVLVGANYTYADSEATFDLDGETVTTEIPGQSKDIFNAILGYDKGRWDLRAAYSFKGENIDDVDSDGLDAGRTIPDQEFLDLSAKVEIVDGLKFYADLKNALDTPLEVSQNGGLLSQYEEYGYSVQAGFIWKN